MHLIKTYKAVLIHQLNWTLMGEISMAEHANLKRIQAFIFSHLDNLELGKPISEELKALSNGYLINLSYTYCNEFYPLYLHVEGGFLKSVTKTVSAVEDESEESAFGYFSSLDYLL